jgi:hypothetical protein
MIMVNRVPCSQRRCGVGWQWLGELNLLEEPPSTKAFIFKGLLRWFITALLCGMYYLMVKVYEGRTLSPNDKSVFDWLTIAVTLALGLNMASSYKEIGLHMKSWFYVKRGVTIRDVCPVSHRN